MFYYIPSILFWSAGVGRMLTGDSTEALLCYCVGAILGIYAEIKKTGNKSEEKGNIMGP